MKIKENCFYRFWGKTNDGIIFLSHLKGSDLCYTEDNVVCFNFCKETLGIYDGNNIECVENLKPEVICILEDMVLKPYNKEHFDKTKH